MLAKAWQLISNRASDLLTILHSAGSEKPKGPQVLDNRSDPLVLPDPPDVRVLLDQAGLPIESATHYEMFYNEFIPQLSRYVKSEYEDAVLKMMSGASDASVQTRYLRALRCGLVVYYNNSVQQVLMNLTSRVTALGSTSKLAPSSLTGSSPPCTSGSGGPRQNRRGRPLVFSKEQTAVLRALLAHDDQFSIEEKELIAQTLNLSRSQVNRWFCNARARGGRKKPYEKPIPRAQRQNLGKYVSDVCQKQRSTSSSSSSGSSTCSQYPSSDDDVDMWPSNALQQNSDSDDSPYLTTEVDPSENIIPMSQLYSQISSTYDETSPETIEIDQSLTSSNFSFSQSTSSSNEFLLPNELSLLLNDPDPFNLNTLSDNSFVESFSYSLNQSNQSEQSWNFL